MSILPILVVLFFLVDMFVLKPQRYRAQQAQKAQPRPTAAPPAKTTQTIRTVPTAWTQRAKTARPLDLRPDFTVKPLEVHLDPEDYVSPEGRCDDHPEHDRPLREIPIHYADPAYGPAGSTNLLGLRLDADAVMQGVIYAEILNRKLPRGNARGGNRWR